MNEETPEKLAAIIAEEDATPDMVPVITKEIYHYYILSAMRENGFLERLTFQGGTSLRLCQASPRYSEDLDFAGGFDFSLDDFTTLGTIIENRLKEISPGSHVTVRPPTRERKVNKWSIQIRTALLAKDMPSQRIKLEIATIPSHDPRMALARVNYAHLEGMFFPIPISAESREEILADKMLSYVASGHIRYRDLWDMGWISGQTNIDPAHVWKMIDLKQSDYSECHARHSPCFQHLGSGCTSLLFLGSRRIWECMLGQIYFCRMLHNVQEVFVLHMQIGAETICSPHFQHRHTRTLLWS